MPERFEFPPRGAESNGEPAALYLPIAFSPFERQGLRQHVQQQRRRAAEAGRDRGAGARRAVRRW